MTQDKPKIEIEILAGAQYHKITLPHPERKPRIFWKNKTNPTYPWIEQVIGERDSSTFFREDNPDTLAKLDDILARSNKSY